jgi:hypothetical protein
MASVGKTMVRMSCESEHGMSLGRGGRRRGAGIWGETAQARAGGPWPAEVYVAMCAGRPLYAGWAAQAMYVRAGPCVRVGSYVRAGPCARAGSYLRAGPCEMSMPWSRAVRFTKEAGGEMGWDRGVGALARAGPGGRPGGSEAGEDEDGGDADEGDEEDEEERQREPAGRARQAKRRGRGGGARVSSRVKLRAKAAAARARGRARRAKRRS